MNEIKYSNGRFDGNSLVVVRTGCGKQLLFKTFQKTNFLETLKRYFGFLRLNNFLTKEKIMLRFVFKIKMFILTIPTM